MTIGGTDVGKAGNRYTRTYEPQVSRKIMGDGTPRVRELSPTVATITFEWPRLTKNQADTLWVVLQYVNRWGRVAQTLVDDWGDSHTVRFWDRSLKLEERLGRYYSVSVTFLKVA